MDKDQLLDLLKIKPTKGVANAKSDKDAKVSPAGVRGRGPTGGVSSAPSQHALQLDAFDMSMGGKLLRHNSHLRETKLEPEAVSDFFSLNFLTSPRTVEKCEDERRLEFVSKTLESPEYLALHRSTELNQIASELASVELARSFSKLREEDKEREKKQQEQRAKGKPVNEAREGLRSDMACYKAVGRGLKAAEKEVDSLEETMTALGCGPGQGNNAPMDVGRVVQMFQQVKDNERLRRIMELAGSYRRSAQAQQRKKVIHGHDDVIGIVLDGDVGRLVPLELAMLATPEMELDALRRLVEKQSMCRQYRGVERVGKGPIVICVDESGSMSGDPICQAKSFALAMAWVARHQSRWIALVGFSGGTQGTRLALPPNKWDESALLEWLVHFYSGGTTLDVPLKELPDIYWKEFLAQGMKRGKTDIILLTDAQVWLPPDIEASFTRWKQEEKARCISIIIGDRAGDLARVSDLVFEVDQLSLESTAIQHCLSI